ncbi:hypothetical protein CEXT_47271 [Caerostris extrusa]|uniref:Uncharacterized protein n=1 Tax=Caerostris extrusa TaxID=172846 RepID=A0AAV4XXE9_CAEEX|nr:hypothetical protein CEXT_47271 [Caerostris extrusa]
MAENSVIWFDDLRILCKPERSVPRLKGFKCKPHYRWFSRPARGMARKQSCGGLEPRPQIRVPGSNGSVLLGGAPDKKAAPEPSRN